MRKRWTASLPALLLAACLLSACGGERPEPAGQESPQILAAGAQSSPSARTEREDAPWSGVIKVIAGCNMAGEGFTAGLRGDGTVLYTGVGSESEAVRTLRKWTGVTRLEYIEGAYLVGYCAGGEVRLAPLDETCRWSDEDLSDWSGIREIVTDGWTCLAGLREDSTVSVRTAEPRGPGGETAAFDVSQWKDIRELCIWRETLFGLKEDGTVVATGAAPDGEWTAWTGIDRLIPYYGLMGLTADGTLVGQPGLGAHSAEGWKNLAEVTCAADSMCGLRRDGTVAFTDGYEELSDAEAQIGQWRGVKQLAFDAYSGYFGRFLPLALCADGTVKAVTEAEEGGIPMPYGAWDVEDWTGVEKLYSGAGYTVGLRGDGSVLATGGERFKSELVDEIGGWKDIVALSASEPDSGESHIVGLKKDGTVVAAGSNANGQCDVLFENAG